jgi:hypothetical protein
MSNHVHIVTIEKPLFLASKGTNVSSATSYVAVSSSSTPPVTTTASTSGWAVVPGAMNYMKIYPRFASGVSNAEIRVIGWSKCTDSNLWIPSLLTLVAISGLYSGDNPTINGASLQSATTISKTLGDCKIFNSTGASVPAFFVVDTVGCDLVQLSFKSDTSSVACNAHIGEI